MDTKSNLQTNLQKEPERQKSDCPYCGDAPINHNLFYFSSLFSMTVDSHILSITRYAPDFIRDFVDFLMASFFNISIFLGISKLGSDINKTKTFRSRVIWEEAEKRGIKMEQVIMLGSPLDQYRARLGGKTVYFNSLPIPPERMNMKKNWDDKFLLKKEFAAQNIPIPAYFQFPLFFPQNLQKIFSKFKAPIIVKPRVGSRGRHTITNIQNLEQFKEGVNVAKQICSYLVAEEHLSGYVCRATFVDGKLMGFYRGGAPAIVGNGIDTVEKLILSKDASRPDRVEKVLINEELRNHIMRSGFKMTDIVPEGIILPLTHRTGRLAGGVTKEMLDELHPSFIPILEKAARIVNLPVVGFDCIVPDPTRPADSQRWGIIECNTLPFIDLHYYALEGKPKNIAGAVWDLWQ